MGTHVHIELTNGAGRDKARVTELGCNAAMGDGAHGGRGIAASSWCDGTCTIAVVVSTVILIC